MNLNSKILLRLIHVLFAIFVFSLTTNFGQQTKTFTSDSWHSLTLDQSTPNETIAALGQPIEDKTDNLRVVIMNKWLNPKYKQNIFRVLKYEKVDEVKIAELAFLDNKLVRIVLVFDGKTISREDLKEKTGVEFIYLKSLGSLRKTPASIEKLKPRPDPKLYPAMYYLVAVTPRSFIATLMGESGMKGVLQQAWSFKSKKPKKLFELNITSRTLANDKQ